eukprot:Opistho-2@26126
MASALARMIPRAATMAIRANVPAVRPMFALRPSLAATASRMYACHSHSVVQIQKPAPEFQATAVVDGQFKQVSLADFKGKWVVLFFYPLDFTFVCPTEIIAFSDRVKEFKELDTEVIGVSVDSHFSHLAWINTPRKVKEDWARSASLLLRTSRRTFRARTTC